MTDTRRLVFRTPFEEHPPTLGVLLERAWPEGTERARDRALEQGRVEIDGRIERNADAEPPPTTRITAEVEGGLVDRESGEATALERGDTWIVADKPVGMPGRLDPDDPMHPIYFLADQLGLDRDTFTPAWPMPTTAGGPWLFGRTPADVTELRRRWLDGELMTTWLAIVPRPEVPEGALHGSSGHKMQYAATTMRDGLAELQLTLSWEGDGRPENYDFPETLRETLADEETPVVGDRRHGGFMATGGLRLRLAALYDSGTSLQHSWNAPQDWFPSEPIVPPEPESPEPESAPDLAELDLPECAVRNSALDRLRGEGHPWIRPPEIAGRHDHLRPGTLVRLRGTNDVQGPIAILDSRPDVAARIWSNNPLDAAEFDATVELRVDEALAERRDLVRDAGETDLFRLVHGEADGLPGIAIDRMGPIVRAEVDGAAAYAFRDTLYDALSAFDESRMILEVERAEDPERGARVARSAGRYLDGEREIVIHEAGLRYRTDPWSARHTVDPSHRTTRAAVRRLASSGERWLVAASPAAALPVALVDAGSERVRLASDGAPDAIRNHLQLNELPVAPLEPTPPAALLEILRDFALHGLVVDLDVGAHALSEPTEEGRREVVARALSALRPGGVGLLLARPSANRSIQAELDAAIERVDVEVVDSDALHPPSDFPRLEHFPEGTPFVGRCLRLAGG